MRNKLLKGLACVLALLAFSFAAVGCKDEDNTNETTESTEKKPQGTSGSTTTGSVFGVDFGDIMG